MPSMSMIETPDFTFGVATLSMDGENVQIEYKSVVDAVQPPNAQIAKALQLLSDHFIAKAAEAVN
jgi:hypothetical protein